METFTTTRYRCEHCHKSYARKGACATHEAECHRDPAVRACTTCAHFTRGRGNSYAANDCAIDAFPVVVVPYGVEQLVDFTRHCTEWAAK